MPLGSALKKYAPLILATGAMLAAVKYQTDLNRARRAGEPPPKKKKKRSESTIHILFCSKKGSTRKYAQYVATHLLSKRKTALVKVQDLADMDAEELLSNEDDFSLVVFLSPTYNDDLPGQGQYFLKAMEDAVDDPRVAKTILERLRFVNIGFGDGAYEESFCKASVRLEDALLKLGAAQLLPLGTVDTHKPDMDGQIDRFLKRATKKILRAARSKAFGLAKKDSSSDKFEIEDAGRMVAPTPSVASDGSSLVPTDGAPQDMLTGKMRAQLTKEGYTVVGQHSGVKICRWTKNMLRGRGGCYKHTFYGIISSRCMEMTPSLACANKCVFCWRHHTNPVAKTWKWKMDEPKEIVEGVLDGHRSMIKPWKGHDLVTKSGYNGAMNPQHCALSLVGEPIMYPKINKILDDLHGKKISTFLVTNAQFPEEMKSLRPVTQLYLSIDAPTPATLKAIDQPLHKDYWDRFIASIDVLRERRDRTIFRLTLVKGKNTDSIPDYARLIARGRPSFIEIKGVTYSGHSNDDINMVNIPFHEEVRHFAQKVAAYVGEDYELACEHAHSCCILIGRKDMKVDGVWHTWINYPRFYELLAKGEPFDALDYSAPTPSWAVFGAPEKGFNPEQKRVIRNRKNARRDMAFARARKEMDEDPEKGVIQNPESVQDVYRTAKALHEKPSTSDGEKGPRCTKA